MREDKSIKITAREIADEGKLITIILEFMVMLIGETLKERGGNIQRSLNINQAAHCLAGYLNKNFPGGYNNRYSSPVFTDSAKLISGYLTEWKNNQEAFCQSFRFISFPLSLNGIKNQAEDVKTYEEAKDFLTAVAAFNEIKSLAKKLDLPSRPTEELEAMIGLRIKGGASLGITGHEEENTQKEFLSDLKDLRTDTFINGIVKLPSSMPVLTGLDSLLHPDRWKADKNQNALAVYEYKGKKNPDNWIEHYISSLGDLKILPFDEAIQIIDKFGLDTAKLHLILSAQAAQEEEPWKSLFTLRGSRLIKDMGWDKRTDLKKPELLNRIAQTAYALNCLLVRAEWEEGRKKNKVYASVETSRMWDIAVKMYGQKDLSGNISNPEEVLLKIRPGLWTGSFLNRGGAASKQALYQFSYLSEKVMGIDPYHNELAIRIALRQSITARYRNSALAVATYLRENLMGAAGKIAEARSDRRRAYDLKQQWDNSLLTLENAGFTIIFDEESYPENLRPGNSTKNPRGYLNKLLEAKVAITPPSPSSKERAMAESAPLPIPIKKKLPDSGQPRITGSDIRKAREAAGLKGSTLANYMGKSRAWLHQKESGKRSLKQKEAEQMLKAIEHLSRQG